MDPLLEDDDPSFRTSGNPMVIVASEDDLQTKLDSNDESSPSEDDVDAQPFAVSSSDEDTKGRILSPDEDSGDDIPILDSARVRRQEQRPNGWRPNRRELPALISSDSMTSTSDEGSDGADEDMPGWEGVGEPIMTKDPVTHTSPNRNANPPPRAATTAIERNITTLPTETHPSSVRPSTARIRKSPNKKANPSSNPARSRSKTPQLVEAEVKARQHDIKNKAERGIEVPYEDDLEDDLEDEFTRHNWQRRKMDAYRTRNNEEVDVNGDGNQTAFLAPEPAEGDPEQTGLEDDEVYDLLASSDREEEDQVPNINEGPSTTGPHPRQRRNSASVTPDPQQRGGTSPARQPYVEDEDEAEDVDLAGPVQREFDPSVYQEIHGIDYPDVHNTPMTEKEFASIAIHAIRAYKGLSRRGEGDLTDLFKIVSPEKTPHDYRTTEKRLLERTGLRVQRYALQLIMTFSPPQ